MPAGPIGARRTRDGAPNNPMETYVLYCSGCRTIKPGRSIDTDQRVRAVQRKHRCYIFHGITLRTLITFEGNIEDEIDARWAASHLHGDWFEYTEAFREDLIAWGAEDVPPVRPRRTERRIMLIWAWLDDRRKRKTQAAS